MNDLEKKSFYSFLALYLISSLLFVLLSAYWYYYAQKNSLERETYYKLEHLADKLSGLIINAHMMGNTLLLPEEKEFEYALIKVDNTKKYEEGYYEEGSYKVLISAAPRKHLNINYVIVKTKSYFSELTALKEYVFGLIIISFIAIIIISTLLGRFFMKPIHKRIEQIDRFIQDISHELNTPITALGMSTSRAIRKGVFDKKILSNISISTKQLETIYKSLTYLNFKQKQEEATDLDLSFVLQRVVHYYSEISNAKQIKVLTNISSVKIKMVESRAELLFSNLLSNAIKYSMPETTMTIVLQNNIFSIEDEGIGIAKERLEEIFELYKRDSHIAGGFGVGLSIVKQICDEYEIKINVNSTLGEGSCFQLFFKK